MRALSGASADPEGGGTRATTASRISRTPMPSLALARMAPSASSPMISSIWRLASSGSAPGQVDLVDDRDDLEVVVDRQVGVGQRLRLHALRGVHEQQRALARRQRPRDLVARSPRGPGVSIRFRTYVWPSSAV